MGLVFNPFILSGFDMSGSGGGGSGASTDLSNLVSPIQIPDGVNLAPLNNNAADIGDVTHRFANGYFSNVIAGTLDGYVNDISGGAIALQGGNNVGQNIGGSVTIVGGQGFAGDGGDVVIQPGPGSTSGAHLRLKSAPGAINTVGQVWTATDTTGAGNWAAPASSGTVTSVALSLPASIFSVTGSPVTTSGTLTGNLNTQTANTVWSGPTTSGAATPTFRALVAADIPSLTATKITGGDANTVAFFNTSGILTDDTNFRYNQTIDTLGFASITSGTLTLTGSGAFGHGAIDSTGTITSSGNGTYAHGNVNASSITASGAGSYAHGHSLTSGASISTSGVGSQAFGFSENGSTIATGNHGSLSFGFAQNSATITTGGRGAIAFGSSTGSLTNITSNGNGSFAGGYNNNSSAKIQALADGCFAFGVSDDFCQINAAPSGGARQGAMAIGFSAKPAAINGLISADTAGAFARGYANGRTISSTGKGAISSGYANAGNITVSGDGAIAHGDQIGSTAAYSATFGIGHTVTTYGSLIAGRYASATGTAASWVATEPLLVLGNGTAIGSEATAYQVDKDGRQTTTAAHIDKLRVIVGTDTLSARIDYKAICNQASGGSFILNLPAGIQGLNFIIGQSTANTATFTVTPNGTDTLDANIQSIFNSNQPVPITFDSGTSKWYPI